MTKQQKDKRYTMCNSSISSSKNDGDSNGMKQYWRRRNNAVLSTDSLTIKKCGEKGHKQEEKGDHKRPRENISTTTHMTVRGSIRVPHVI
mmetsp:Transcript_24717/g.56848  ORF Transcript_24717/g.56848 Transcript_24717/m.56848 type:complete len:90 (+) Transcript_24717:1722-1991(+)